MNNQLFGLRCDFEYAQKYENEQQYDTAYEHTHDIESSTKLGTEIPKILRSCHGAGIVLVRHWRYIGTALACPWYSIGTVILLPWYWARCASGLHLGCTGTALELHAVVLCSRCIGSQHVAMLGVFPFSVFLRAGWLLRAYPARVCAGLAHCALASGGAASQYGTSGVVSSLHRFFRLRRRLDAATRAK